MPNQTTKEDAARVQSTQAKAGNDTTSGSFPARLQSAADKNANAGGQGGKQSSGGQSNGNSSNGSSGSAGSNGSQGSK